MAKTVAFGSGATINLWDVSSKKPIATLMGHKKSVTSVAYSPDGKILASGSFDGTIKLWDVNSKQLNVTLPGHTEAIFSVAFSPDGKTLASGSKDGFIRLWNLTPFVELPLFIQSLYANTDGLKTFLLLHKIFESNADKDKNGKPKKPEPLKLYQPEAIALLKKLPAWLQKRLQEKRMVQVFIKKKQEDNPSKTTN